MRSHVGPSLLITCVSGFCQLAVAQEILIDPIFEPGTLYRFEISENAYSETKIEMDGEREEAKTKIESVITVSLTASPDESDRSTLTASIERMRGSQPNLLDEGITSYDTDNAPDERPRNLKEQAELDPGQFVALSMKGLMDEPIEIVISGGKVVPAESEKTDGDALGLAQALNGPARSIRHLVEFAINGFPNRPVRPGDRWQRNVEFPTGSGPKALATHFNYEGSGRAPGAAKSIAKISYRAKLAQPDGAASKGLLGLGIKMKRMDVTGTMFYDPDERTFTHDSRSIRTEGEILVPTEDESEMEVMGNVNAHASYTVKLASLEAGAAAGNKGGGTATPQDLTEERTWTNGDGRQLTAALISVSGETGSFRRPSGEVFEYSIGNLSEPDRELIVEISGSQPPSE